MRVFILLGALLMVGCNAFLGLQPSTHRSFPLFMAVELKPEPEGGEELTALSSMDGSRMKNMVCNGVQVHVCLVDDYLAQSPPTASSGCNHREKTAS